MTLMRWVLFSLLLVFGGWAIICNWVVTLRRRGSYIPVVGGVIVTIALLVTPLDAIRSLWWAPLVVDLGCMPTLVMVMGFLIWRAISKQGK